MAIYSYVSVLPDESMGRIEINGLNNFDQTIGVLPLTASFSHYFGYAFFDGPDGMITIDYSPYFATVPAAVNDEGQIVGMIKGGASPYGDGFIYENGKFRFLTLPTFPGFRGGYSYVAPHGINNSGVIVGVFGSEIALSQGFILNKGTYTEITGPGAFRASPNGINNLGQVVGSYSDTGVVSHGFFCNYSPGVIVPRRAS